MSVIHWDYLNRRGLCVLYALLIATLTGWHKNAHAYDPAVSREDLIVEVTKPPSVLSGGLIVIQKGARYYLPLIELAELMDLYISTDLTDGYINGFYPDEGEPFRIHINDRTLERSNQHRDIDDIEIIDDDPLWLGDLYILQETVEEIWPGIRFRIDLSQLQLIIESNEALPFEARRIREQSRSKIANRQDRRPKAPDISSLPLIANDYRLFSLPMIDLETDMRWHNGLTGRTTIVGRQDLGYMSALYSGTIQHDSKDVRNPQALRLRLERRAYGIDPMPLGIRSVDAGDVRINPQPMIGSSFGGRGLSVSSRISSGDLNFDLITVDGPGQPGWEVELYRNGELIDFGLVDSSGEYRFENVEIGVGNNQIRIAQYGPQGQVREDFRHYTIGAAMVAPGQTEYRADIMDAGQPLIPWGQHSPTAQAQGTAGNLYIAHGLHNLVTAFSSFSQIPTRHGDHQYASAGAMFSAFHGFGQIEAYKQIEGGHALDTRFATTLFGLRLNLRGALYSRFESPDAGFGDAAKRFETEARASTSMRLPFGALGLQADIHHMQNRLGTAFTRIGTRQSISRAGIHLSHDTITHLIDRDHQFSSGRLNASYRYRHWLFRGHLHYDLYPDPDLSMAQAEIRYRAPNSFTAALRAQHAFYNNRSGFGAQIGYDFGTILGSIDADWRQQDGLALILRASTSIGPIRHQDAYGMSSQRLTNATPLQAIVYLDGIDEQPVEGATVMAGSRHLPDRSDADGRLSTLFAGHEGISAVRIAPDSLPDPYYQPANDGYAVVLRPGTVPVVPLPVLETGAIDGTVYRSDTGRPVSGLRIQLADETGNLVNAAETAYDGYYTFEFIRPGIYTVRADPETGADIVPQTVTLSADAPFAFGVDLELDTDGAVPPEDDNNPH